MGSKLKTILIFLFVFFFQINFIFANEKTSPLSDEIKNAIKALNEKNYEKTLTILKPLAEKGDPVGQYFLGTMYFSGNGVNQNYLIAFKYFSLSAEQGHRAALNDLGGMYLEGLGIKKDYRVAFELISMSALQEFKYAYPNLGKMYAMGLHVKNWKSAALGIVSSQITLAKMYLKGLGVKQDNIYAYMWFNIARLNGRKEVRQDMMLLEFKMNKDEVDTAVFRTVLCMSTYKYKDCNLVG